MFSLRLGISQKCLLSSLLFNITLEVLARAVWQGKEIKSIQIGKEEVDYLFFVDMILYIQKTLKAPHKNKTARINGSSKVTEYTVNRKISRISLHEQ